MNQAAPDIKKKLQKLDRLGERNIRDLIMVAERIFNIRESAEEKELKKWKKTSVAQVLEECNHWALTKILAISRELDDGSCQGIQQATSGYREGRNKGQKTLRLLGRNQCLYWKEKGHWVRECPKKQQKTKVLEFDVDIN